MAAVGQGSAKWRTSDQVALERRPQAELSKYRLVRGNGSAVGRAAYHADIGPGDVIADYQGQWWRVLEFTPIDDEDSVYDGTLKVEPAC